MKPRSEIDRIIEALSASKEVLQPEAIQAVCSFVQQSQTSTGAFIDRGGHGDWYYSFFGFLISKAFNLKQELKHLESYILNKKSNALRSQIDWAVWVLLRHSFQPKFLFKLNISIKLAFRWIKNRQQADQVYFTFLSLLILNHFWGWARCISTQIDQLTSAFILNDHSPTSHLAATLLIRHQAGLNIDKLTEQLLKHTHPDGGFVSFGDHATPDLLSTAVAAYALSQSTTQLGPLAANGFDFISEQFNNGAFLSGDGDPTRDLEYTFYGLLGLSAYSKSLTTTHHGSN